MCTPFFVSFRNSDDGPLFLSNSESDKSNSSSPDGVDLSLKRFLPKNFRAFKIFQLIKLISGRNASYPTRTMSWILGDEKGVG